MKNIIQFTSVPALLLMKVAIDVRTILTSSHSQVQPSGIFHQGRGPLWPSYPCSIES